MLIRIIRIISIHDEIIHKQQKQLTFQIVQQKLTYTWLYIKKNKLPAEKFFMMR